MTLRNMKFISGLALLYYNFDDRFPWSSVPVSNLGQNVVFLSIY